MYGAFIIMILQLHFNICDQVYRLNQTELSNFETLRLYQEVTDKFLADYPDFWGAKYIVSLLNFLRIKYRHPSYISFTRLVCTASVSRSRSNRTNVRNIIAYLMIGKQFETNLF